MPIQTRAEFDTVKQALALEMQKPEASRDVEFIQKAVTELRAAEIQFGAAAVDPGQAARAEFFAGSVLEDEAALTASERAVERGALSGMDVPPTQLPIGSLAMSQGVDERLVELRDMLMRAVLGRDEQAALAVRRAQETAARRIQLEEQARRQGVPRSSLNLDRSVGSIVPDALLAIGPGMAIRGAGAGPALARIASEGAMGGLAALASTPLTVGPDVNMALGAVGGVGIGFLAELPGFVRNTVLQDAMRAAKNPETKRNLELARTAGIDLSLAEASLDDRVRSMEQAIPARPGSPRTEFSRRRQLQIIRAFAQLDETLNPQRLSSDQIIHATRTAYNDYVQELGTIASRKFVDTLRPVAKELGATIDDRGRIIGGERVIQVDNLLTEYRTQLRLATEAPRTITPAQEAELLANIQELEAARRQGGMTLGKAQTYLKELTEASYPTGNTHVQQRLNAAASFDPRALRDALLADLDGTISSLGRGARARFVQGRPEFSYQFEDIPPTDPGPGSRAARALQQARDQYAQDIALIDALRNQAIDRLLGKVGGRVDSEDFVRNLLSMPNRQFNELMFLVDQAKPGLSNAIRSRIFAELADKHRLLSPGGGVAGTETMLDTRGFVTEFAQMPFSRFQAIVGLNATQTQKVQNAFKVLQLIAEGPEQQSFARGALQWIEGVAINAVSRSPEFISRLLAGRLGPGFFEQALFTPEGLRSLEIIGTKGASRTAITQAFNSLLQIAAGIDARKEELIRQEQQRQLTELLRAPGRQLP